VGNAAGQIRQHPAAGVHGQNDSIDRPQGSKQGTAPPLGHDKEAAALGFQALGLQALGFQALGFQALGLQALGLSALGL
jgi:hypothetical protein